MRFFYTLAGPEADKGELFCRGESITDCSDEEAVRKAVERDR